MRYSSDSSSKTAVRPASDCETFRNMANCELPESMYKQFPYYLCKFEVQLQNYTNNLFSQILNHYIILSFFDYLCLLKKHTDNGQSFTFGSISD